LRKRWDLLLESAIFAIHGVVLFFVIQNLRSNRKKTAEEKNKKYIASSAAALARLGADFIWGGVSPQRRVLLASERSSRRHDRPNFGWPNLFQ
jgi:hypothetical protein